MKQAILNNSGPLVLLIIDGWGIGQDNDNNLIFKTETKTFDELISRFPATVLKLGASNLGENYRLLGTGDTERSLSAIISSHGLSQLKIAEAEKYAYVTYFLNNKKDEAEENEDRILVPTNLIDSYQDKPDMASSKVVSETIKAIKSAKYNFITSSLANLDLVAQTGDRLATIRAIELLDNYIKKIVKTIINKKGTLIITACRGGAEMMENKKSSNPIPFIIVNDGLEGKMILAEDASTGLLSAIKPSANLSNVAPTILKLLEIDENLPSPSLI